MIKILVVDDHTIFRSGLRKLLSDEPDMRVDDEARDVGEMLAKLRRASFDVVLLDVSMAGRSGLEAMPSVRAEFPKLPVLFLSMYPAEQYAVVALRAGASGYLTKDAESEELILAIREVAAGRRYLSSTAAQRLLLQTVGGDDDQPPHHRLSAREHQIMLMIVQGISLTEIGKQMFISVKTVSSTRTRILQKIGVDNNAELVLYAVRHRIVHG
ncbi:DNA-binding NarL/FixJ family response regulator [Acidovorax soli]|uniref:DNA-binding NarL/FixJ family response regulator n=1 Tax=Acidovorax soli TaxID=592050 RepID=A0A7X0U901_9BURK|nr:response regulator transcription factor [Acidovorax soli]MBB6559334.1 DNA-binding NarL/FixJ family response regulator [Acidovorax soli]